MPNVVDSLVVELGLDPSKFTEGQKQALDAFHRTQEAAVAGAKNIESQGKRTTEYFAGLKREALTLLAVFMGGRGIAEMVNHITNLDASTARLARTFNISTENLAKWQIAVREVGGSAESARSAIGGIAGAVQSAAILQNWDPNMVALFSRMGLDRSEWADPDKVLSKLAEFGQSPGMKGHPERFAAWAKFMPGMNQDLINLLTDPRYNQLMANAAKMTPAGGGIGPESEEFQTRFALFSVAMENVARVVLDKLIPAMDKVTELFTSWVIAPGSAEAEKLEKKLNDDIKKKSFSSTAKGFADWVDYGMWGLPVPSAAGKAGTPEPAGPRAGRKAVGGIEQFGGITGIQVIEGGLVTYSGPLGGPGAAAVSSTITNRSSRNSASTSTTKIEIHNINLPGVKDAPSFIGGLDDVIRNQSHGAAVNSGAQ